MSEPENAATVTDRVCAPAAVTAAMLGVPPARLRIWALRYELRRYRHPTGVLLYDVLDAARIKAATRAERQRRLPAKPRPLV